MEKSERINRVKLMELLVICLYFAQSYGKESRIRVNINALDIALKSARRRGAFPPWGKKNLHFANGRSGIICIELEELLRIAYDCGCIEYDQTCCFARVIISQKVALQFLKEIGIGKKKARKWGRFIREELEVEERLFFGDSGDL